MARPVVLVVDDDESARYHLERDLERRYGKRYRIVGVSSGSAAVDRLRHLAAGNEPVALLLVDQRMSDMTGVELIEQGRTLVPLAKRVLLTTYPDGEAAIAAMKRLTIDHYVLKPWQPPR